MLAKRTANCTDVQTAELTVTEVESGTPILFRPDEKFTVFFHYNYSWIALWDYFCCDGICCSTKATTFVDNMQLLFASYRETTTTTSRSLKQCKEQESVNMDKR
ncbi:hypothetical protein T07_14826 [Trichinella nelsoni]|uniref:Uncharacterized protein n=1 Tax=Trichinella nelsoni TaxID=6336 RepID=A0A0V0S7J5_9BILA|nr:hypothetical protein T07_14826 [Trichinella nelsoni]